MSEILLFDQWRSSSGQVLLRLLISSVLWNLSSTISIYLWLVLIEYEKASLFELKDRIIFVNYATF